MRNRPFVLGGLILSAMVLTREPWAQTRLPKAMDLLGVETVPPKIRRNLERLPEAQLPTMIASSLNRRVSDSTYLRFLAERGKEFIYRSQSKPLRFDSSAVYDIGGMTPNTGATLAIVDKAQSQEVTALIAALLKAKPEDLQIGMLSRFVVQLDATKEAKKPVFLYDEQFLVFNLREPRKFYTLDEVQLTAHPVAPAPTGKRREASFTTPSTTVEGAYRRIVGRDAAGTPIFYNISNWGKPSLWKRKCGLLWPWRYSVRVEIKKLAASDLEKTEAAKQEGQIAGVGIQWGTATATPSPATIQTADGDTGTVSQGLAPDAEISKGGGPTTDKGVVLHGQPDAITWDCKGKCTTGECQDCCANTTMAVMGIGVGVAVSCGAVTLACPPCLIGCGVLGLVSIAVPLALNYVCLENCEKIYWDEGKYSDYCR